MNKNLSLLGVGALHRGLLARGFAGLALMAGLAVVSSVMAQAPQVVSVTPTDGETGVATNASLVIVFDQAMNTTVPPFPSTPPFLTGNYQITPAGTVLFGAWGEDGRTLTFFSQFAPLPADTTIGWTLNPTGVQPQLQIQSATGQPLATTGGSFTTGTGDGGGNDCDPDGVPDSWGNYSLYKAASYVQTSPDEPTPEDETPFGFASFVLGPDGGPLVTAASVTLPGGTVTNLNQAFPGFFSLGESFDTEAELNAAYPNGDYTLRFTRAGESERAFSGDLTTDGVPVPKITNFTEAQDVNASADFTLSWNPFTGAGARDFLSVTVSDPSDPLDGLVFQAPDPCVPIELPVTATSVVIPAGTLQSNKTYNATISFERFSYQSTNDVPEMSGFFGHFRSTQFTIDTGPGGSAEPARLKALGLLPNGNPEMEVSGTPSKNYSIRRTSDLNGTPIWTPVGSVTLDGDGNAVFEDTFPGKVFPLFYQAVATD